jgi:hypothetical protein
MIGQETCDMGRKIAAILEILSDSDEPLINRAMCGVVDIGQLRSFWSL